MRKLGQKWLRIATLVPLLRLLNLVGKGCLHEPLTPWEEILPAHQGPTTPGILLTQHCRAKLLMPQTCLSPPPELRVPAVFGVLVLVEQGWRYSKSSSC